MKMDTGSPLTIAQRTVTTALQVLGTEQLVLGWTADASRTTESPVEAAFSVHFRAVVGHMLLVGFSRYLLQLRPQVWVETPSGARYRVDFALEPSDPWLAQELEAHGYEMKVGVELDGHEFHERTTEQVTARNRRDRELSALGWRVLHFSGSEVHRDPVRAAVEALEAGAEALDAARKRMQHERQA